MSSPTPALKAFEDSPDLLRLESLLKRFNLFEAIGVIRQELRHSDLLACLLDPRQSHGLGTLFLSELLNAVTPRANGLDWHKARTEREWNNVDILVVDDSNRLVVIIENKIDTTEHSGQLSRYYADVRSHFLDYGIIGLYLTPNGEVPSDDYYLAVSYSQICQILEKAIDEHQELSVDVVVVLKHYAQILRRHIMSDSDVAELCRDIYKKHKQALDVIIKHIPPQQDLISQYVKQLINQQDQLKAGGSGKNYVTFSIDEWQDSPRHGGELGENVCWILYFAFNDISDGLKLDLKIAPGDALERERHLQMAQKNRFRGYASKLTGQHSRIASVNFLSASDYERSQGEIETIISEKWAEYMRDEFPRIVQAVRDEKWLWETPPGE